MTTTTTVTTTVITTPILAIININILTFLNKRMSGELHDATYTSDDTFYMTYQNSSAGAVAMNITVSVTSNHGHLWYTSRNLDANKILDCALCLLGVYYVILKPIELMYPEFFRKYGLNPVDEFEATESKPRFPFIFKSWREYQNLQ